MASQNPTDPLRPTEEAATEAWAARVRAEREQVERSREVDEPADYFAPMAERFAHDPERGDEPALEILASLVGRDETWLDIGAGGGRYALPIALRAAKVHAIDPSSAMLDVLRAGMTEHGITNIEISQSRWPMADEAPLADVALMAHVGYDIEAFGALLDAAEAAVTQRCVVIMRIAGSTTPRQLLWQEVHGEPRVALPVLPELLALLLARGTVPEVTLCERPTWGYSSRDALLEASRRQLWLRPGSTKDQHLQRIVTERATERDGTWAFDWSPMREGVVTWEPHARP